jgi:hypothetical protein
MNSLNRNIAEDEVVVLKEKYYKGDENARKFKCKSGFGMKLFTAGTAIFGSFVKDGEVRLLGSKEAFISSRRKYYNYKR